MPGQHSGSKPHKLAVVASHPIQYQAPLFRALAARNDVQLDVYFCCDEGMREYQDREFGVRVKWDIPLTVGYRSRMLRNYGVPAATNFFRLLNPGVLMIALRRRYDAVLVHGWAHGTEWLAWAACLFGKTQLLVRGDSNGFRQVDSVKRRIRRFVVRRFLARTSSCLAIGKCNTEFYSGLGVPRDRIHFVPFSVDNEFFRASYDQLARDKAGLRRELGLDPSAAVILYCGKFIGVKRLRDLVAAVARLERQLNAVLVLVGDGPLRPELEQQARVAELKRVVFAGFRNQSEITRYYAAADVFVLPSSDEHWGLSINEAMCFSLPVIASDGVGAAADLIEEGVNGFTYPCGDIDALAGRMAEVLRQPAVTQKMGNESWKIIQRWGCHESASHLVRTLDEILS